jgi:hypothetical protein
LNRRTAIAGEEGGQRMPLDAAVKDWLRNNACGEIYIENARAGISLGLHTITLVKLLINELNCRFRDEAARATSSSVVSYKLSAEHVGVVAQSMAMRRWHADFEQDKAAAEADMPDLAHFQIVTVTEIHNLAYVMSSQQFESLGFAQNEFGLDSGDRFWAELEQELRDRPEDQRRFGFASLSARGKPGSLGRGLLWFTTWPGLVHYCDLDAEPPLSAERARDALGLVERKREQRLVAISFSGRVLSRALHRRPIFVDSGGYRRFMAASSTGKPSVDSAWGQTAHLFHLEAGHENCDGAPERVVPALGVTDFGGETFTLHPLGELPSTRGADRPASDERFRDLLRRAISAPPIQL